MPYGNIGDTKCIGRLNEPKLSSFESKECVDLSYKDLSGEKFGRWTITDEAEPKYIKGNRRIRYWNCVCECGTKRAVLERSLKNGTSKSCGCYHSEIMHDVGKVNATHNMSDSRLYRIYKHMHNRCYNENDIRFDRYGGRGISVVDKWHTFEAFMEWALSNGYNDSLSIDRIDPDGNYSPENCRWANKETQANNKSNNRCYTYNGETHTIAEWAKIINMPYKKLWKRFCSGWSPERALTT